MGLSLLRTGAAVEKLHFSQNSEILGDRKCPRKPRTSFVGLPSAKFFRPVLRDRVFQQPQVITLVDPRLLNAYQLGRHSSGYAECAIRGRQRVVARIESDGYAGELERLPPVNAARSHRVAEPVRERGSALLIAAKQTESGPLETVNACIGRFSPLAEQQCVSAHSSCAPLTFDINGEILISSSAAVLPRNVDAVLAFSRIRDS